MVAAARGSAERPSCTLRSHKPATAGRLSLWAARRRRGQLWAGQRDKPVLPCTLDARAACGAA
eukprot:5742538-Prymnesium_polylepis.1